MPGGPGAEAVEGRGLPEGNTASETRPGRSAGQGVSSDLDRVRQVARKDRDVRFTALLHHVTVDRLREAYRAISPNAAAGVDGVTWRDYGLDLEANLRDLHARVHRGAYRARPTRRVFIPKPDGRLRPLGVAALEDKILQRAVVEVLNAIYEEDFLGFSYGFRPGRSQHDALDALAVGITRKKVSCVLDADIRDFFTEPRPVVACEVPRASDRGQEGPAADPEMAQGRSHRGRGMVEDGGGDGAGGIGIAVALERLPSLRVRPVGRPVAAAARARGRDSRAVRRRLSWRALSIVRTPSGSLPIFASGSRSSGWSCIRRRRG